MDNDDSRGCIMRLLTVMATLTFLSLMVNSLQDLYPDLGSVRVVIEQLTPVTHATMPIFAIGIGISVALGILAFIGEQITKVYYTFDELDKRKAKNDDAAGDDAAGEKPKRTLQDLLARLTDDDDYVSFEMGEDGEGRYEQINRR